MPKYTLEEFLSALQLVDATIPCYTNNEIISGSVEDVTQFVQERVEYDVEYDRLWIKGKNPSAISGACAAYGLEFAVDHDDEAWAGYVLISQVARAFGFTLKG